MNKKILAISLLFTITDALAVIPNVTGKVTGYISSESGGIPLFIFQTESNPSGGCNTTGRFAVGSTSPLFKGTQSAVMAAYHSQSVVTVYYEADENACKALGNAKDIKWVCVGSIPC